jgi:hypothetical protein
MLGIDVQVKLRWTKTTYRNYGYFEIVSYTKYFSFLIHSNHSVMMREISQVLRRDDRKPQNMVLPSRSYSAGLPATSEQKPSPNRPLFMKIAAACQKRVDLKRASKMSELENQETQPILGLPGESPLVIDADNSKGKSVLKSLSAGESAVPEELKLAAELAGLRGITYISTLLELPELAQTAKGTYDVLKDDKSTNDARISAVIKLSAATASVASGLIPKPWDPYDKLANVVNYAARKSGATESLERCGLPGQLPTSYEIAEKGGQVYSTNLREGCTRESMNFIFPD